MCHINLKKASPKRTNIEVAPLTWDIYINRERTQNGDCQGLGWAGEDNRDFLMNPGFQVYKREKSKRSILQQGNIFDTTGL